MTSFFKIIVGFIALFNIILFGYDLFEIIKDNFQDDIYIKLISCIVIIKFNAAFITSIFKQDD